MRFALICVSGCALALLPVVVFLLLLTGCGARTIYVKDGEPVRLRQSVKACKVWVADKDGKEVPSTLDVPEGWYALPDPGK